MTEFTDPAQPSDKLRIRTDWLIAIGRYLRTIYDFHVIIYREFVADHLTLRAMSLTQGTVLSLVPLFVILIALFKLLGGGEWFDEVVRPALVELLAPGIEPVVSEKVNHLISAIAAKTLGVVGGLFLIIGVHVIFISVEMTFNLIWGGSPRGRQLVRAPIYWSLILSTPVFIAASLAITAYLTALPVVGKIGFFDVILRHLAPGGLVTLGMLLVFRFLPTAPVKWKSAIVGALVAGVAYEVVKSLFIFYTRELVRYDALYGSLAILPITLIWINLAWIVTLYGVEVCYVFQHFDQLRQKAKHVPLSRLQQDALGWCIIRSLTVASEGDNKWIDAAKLSDQWGVPPGLTNGIVQGLIKDGIIVLKAKSIDVIRLAKPANTIRISDIDQALRSPTAEVWTWPDDPLWKETRLWLQLRERRGVVKTETLDKINVRMTTKDWKLRDHN